MKKLRTGFMAGGLWFTITSQAQQNYPTHYFRQPLNIPLQLVANFGEVRANHWHMGLDIRTQHKTNLPVYAAADGYVSRVSIEPGGFGQAIYVQHPNGYTTLYGHLNSFYPQLEQYVKEQQYSKETWEINLSLQPGQFPVTKGMFLALSGSTGASEGPHVHFEIRDSQTGNCLNPLVFGFPIVDDVPPTVNRLAVYDRNQSTYAQTPDFLALKKKGAVYTTENSLIRVGSNQISFAIGATDRFSGSSNPNGIYSAEMFVDGKLLSGFQLNNISYNDTRYINAQLDFPLKARGITLQHLTPLPGASRVPYEAKGNGVLHLKDQNPHHIDIMIRDAQDNITNISFEVQYDGSLAKPYQPIQEKKLIPNQVNIFETTNFELFTTDLGIYDTLAVRFSSKESAVPSSISSLFEFLGPSYPVHDQVTVRILPVAAINDHQKQRLIIQNMSGSKTFVKKATWQNGWVAAAFRQFGNYQAFVDEEPPLIPSPPSNLSRTSRLAFTPTDNHHVVKNFRAELDGHWLRFSNDKGKTWVYKLDEKFPAGEHELKVHVEDEAGNVTEKTWKVRR